MRKFLFLAAAFGVFGLIAPTSAPAAAAGGGPKARIFAEFDTNKNGIIDGDEIVAVRKAFAADPKGQFAVYDTNKDGKLDDAEIAAIKPPGGGGKKGAAAKKEKGSDEKKADDAPADKTAKTDKP